jgi:hypothetical protein
MPEWRCPYTEGFPRCIYPVTEVLCGTLEPC